MKVKSYEVTDSRGVRWSARLSGPTRAGSLQPGQSIHTLPEFYLLRYRREGDSDHEIVVDLHAGDVSREEAKMLLEQQPEWIYEDWAKP